MFVDHVRVYAKAGDGGAGSASFRRESFVPRGGPDGGDGGNGGSVILRADSHTDSLVSLFYDPHLRAKDGGRGLGKKKYGKTSPDKVVMAPIGTLVTACLPARRFPPSPPPRMTRRRSQARRSIHRRSNAWQTSPRPGQEFVLCKGGKGGKGNVHFKSARNQAPTRGRCGDAGGGGIFFPGTA